MSTTTYLVLLRGSEEVWEARDEAQRRRHTLLHETFVQHCTDAGHEVLDGQELRAASTSTVLRAAPSGGGRVLVTDGPYAETAEQLGGTYVVRTGDRPGLQALLGALLDPEGGITSIEVRPAVGGA